ncbi:MAG: hypothetical protein ABI612_13225 [Betaproteobacteria bacterium]
MKWRKLGLLYQPDGTIPWAVSHAMVPTPVLLNDEVLRVYMNCCDTSQILRPGYVDLQASDITRVMRVSQQPLLEPGTSGSFDDNGVVAVSVVKVEPELLYMYYVGFELGTKIRYRLLTGLAISEDAGETFKRVSRTPVLERSDDELYFRCAPHVLFENGRFRMWYIAGSEWTTVGDKTVPVYDLRYAESDDGVRWPAAGRVCMRVNDPDEHGFGRPWVIHDPEGYRMFYSVRRRSLGAYRLGYAESANGLDWNRRDTILGIDVSETGWDSEAVMYAAVTSLRGNTYALYNGNEFGKDGFGAAVLERE